MTDDSVSHLLFEVKKTQVRMMKNRGYDITDEINLFDMTKDQFLEHYKKRKQLLSTTFRGALNYTYTKTNLDESSDNTYVYYFDTMKDKKQLCTGQIDDMLNLVTKFDKVNRITLISEQKIHNQSETKIKAIKEKDFQHFLYEELAADPSLHISVPKHKILTRKEKEDLIKDTLENISFSNFPRFLVNDVMVKYLWGVPGDIIKIIRVNFLVNLPVAKSISYGIVEKELEEEKENN